MSAALSAVAQGWDTLIAGDVGTGVDADGGEMPALYAATLRYVGERKKLGEFRLDTARSNWYCLARFADTVGPELPVGRLHRRHVEKWLLSRDVAPGTLRKELTIVRSFVRWCVEHDLLRRDVTMGIKGPTRARAKPRALASEQVAKLLLEADERGVVCLLLMVQEGLRRGEVVRLDTEAVDLDKRVLFVVGKGGHQRWLPLSDETAKAIDVYLTVYPAGPGMPLVRSYASPTRGITAHYLGALVRGWMRSAGVKARAWDGKSAHALRHTAAHDILDAGADPRDLQEFLGHVHLSTTSIYTNRQAAVGRLRDAASGRTYMSGR